MLAYITACYWLGAYYHSGQSSKGYQLTCQAEQYALREYGIDMGRQVYNLRSHNPILSKPYRSAVAGCLWRMRKYRFSM